MFSIGTISELTGLTPETIRAWERRYGAVRPARSEGGHRLYDENDLDRLTLLNRACKTGRPIGAIAALGNDQLTTLLERDRPAGARAPHEAVGRIVAAVRRFDSVGCERELGTAIASLPFRDAAENVVLPALVEVGDLWARSRLTIAHERLLSSVVHRLLMSILNAAGPGRRARLVLGTLPGEEHVIGCLVAAVLAAQAGFRAHYVGTSLPVREFARTADKVGAAAAVVCFVHQKDAARSREEAQALRRALPGTTELWLAGHAAPMLDGQIEATAARRMCEFDDFTRSLELLEVPTRLTGKAARPGA
jgi:DNA-binding transcriptional MerR regulator/methylmalonyl-CoA mutase cobalamin-binding subunit